MNVVNDPDVKLLLFILLIAALAGTFWYFQDDILLPDEPVAVPSDVVAEERRTKSGPAHPIAPIEQSASSERRLVRLPPLDDSDSYFLLALVDIFGHPIESVLKSESLVDNFVATIDNLPRSHVAEKIRPVGRLSRSFAADASGDNGVYYLNPDSYARYAILIDLVVGADLEVVAETYRRFYPLFQGSYVRLGYPGGYFNDRLVEVIDLLLITPEVDDPIRLIRPHVLYEFADTELEALSSGQKLLLRSGGENTARIKRILREFRALIV